MLCCLTDVLLEHCLSTNWFLCVTENPTGVGPSLSIFFVSAQFIIMAEEIHVIKKRQKVRVMECMICKITHISHIILSPICLIHPEEKNTKKYITTLLRTLSCNIHKHNSSSNHFIIFHKCSYYFLPHLLR